MYVCFTNIQLSTSFYLPALTLTSRLDMDPTTLEAMHLYIVACTSCRYSSALNGENTSVPSGRTCLSPAMSATDEPSFLIHRINGRGFPWLEHGTVAPVEFINSTLGSGSTVKEGPLLSVLDKTSEKTNNTDTWINLLLDIY